MLLIFLFLTSILFSQDPMAKDTPHNQAFISNLLSKPLMDAWSTGPVTVSAKGDLIFNSNGDSKGGKGTQTFLYALGASNAVYRVSRNITEDEIFFTTNVFRGIILKKDGLHIAGVLSTPTPPETKREDPSAWSRYIETYYAVSNISFDTLSAEPWIYRMAELQKPETNVQTDRAFIQNLRPRNLVDCYGMETETFDNGDIALNGSKRGILNFWFARSPTEGVYKVSKEWAEASQWDTVPRKEAATNWVIGLVLRPRVIRAAQAQYNYKISRADSRSPALFRRYWELAFGLDNLDWKKLSPEPIFFDAPAKPVPKAKASASFLKKIQSKSWKSASTPEAEVQIDASGNIIFEESGERLGALLFLHARNGRSALYKIDADYAKWKKLPMENIYFGIKLRGGDLWISRSRFLPPKPMDKDDKEAQALYHMRTRAKENIDWKISFGQPFLIKSQ